MFAGTNTKEYFLRPSLLIPENRMRAVTHTVNDQQYHLGIKKKIFFKFSCCCRRIQIKATSPFCPFKFPLWVRCPGAPPNFRMCPESPSNRELVLFTLSVSFSSLPPPSPFLKGFKEHHWETKIAPVVVRPTHWECNRDASQQLPAESRNVWPWVDAPRCLGAASLPGPGG